VNDTLASAKSAPDPRVYSVNVAFKAGRARYVVFNSNGVQASEDHTDATLSCDVTVKDGDEMNSDYDLTSGRDLKQLDTRVGSRAVARAMKTLGKVNIETGVYPVVLSPRAVGTMIAASIARAINAEVVQQGMSFLGEKLRTSIAPSHFTLVDNPRMETGSRALSTSFDGEGFPTSRKMLVNAGVLETFLHNSYTAGKGKVNNTGNAIRSGYSSLPRIGVFNLHVLPARDHVVPDAQLLEGIKTGIYFDQTYDSPNMATGDFSGMISSGFLIENGEITDPLSQAAFGVNLLTLFQAIELYGDTKEDRAGLITPAIRLGGLHVSGNL
jgi:PmbA protein